jgi:CelD/BcsL family acetyltransferase involved in cellulose biosynthesis
MHIEETNSFEDFLRLEAAWDELCAQRPEPAFFLSHWWFRCCWPGPETGLHPLVLVARRGSEIAGIAPLMVRKVRWRGLPARAITLMQNQDSPRADFVLSPVHGRAALAALLDHLARRRGWDLLWLGKIERGASTHHMLSELLAGTTHLRRPAARCPLLEIGASWEEFWTGHSQRFKKTVRNVANRVERLGEVSVTDMAATATPAECLKVFRDVAALSHKRDLSIAVGRNDGIGRFFAGLTEALHRRSRLRLWVLRLDGKPIATEYHVRDGDRAYALRSDFDDRHREVSPGSYLSQRIIRAYFDGGVRIYDMGPGDSEYKERWATGAADLDSFWVFNRTFYPAALYRLEQQIVPRLRRVLTG